MGKFTGKPRYLMVKSHGFPVDLDLRGVMEMGAFYATLWIHKWITESKPKRPKNSESVNKIEFLGVMLC